MSAIRNRMAFLQARIDQREALLRDSFQAREEARAFLKTERYADLKRRHPRECEKFESLLFDQTGKEI